MPQAETVRLTMDDVRKIHSPPTLARCLLCGCHHPLGPHQHDVLDEGPYRPAKTCSPGPGSA